jgi:hypothetical protein
MSIEAARTVRVMASGSVSEASSVSSSNSLVSLTNHYDNTNHTSGATPSPTGTTTTKAANPLSNTSGVVGSVGLRSPLRSPFRNLRPLSRLRKRRSRSAPASTLRHYPLEHHFRIDVERNVVLPGVPTYEEDWARDSHDFFNLIVLIPIVVLNVMNWNWDIVFKLSWADLFSRNAGPVSAAWTGEWFDLFFTCTFLYFLVDLLWIVILPKCVKSPSTIIQHHLITMAYVMFPYCRPNVRWCMGACMSVEVNTWFLIARRVFNKQGFSPWVIGMSFLSIRVKLISICFYVTWIAFRCILYPILLLHFIEMWWHRSIELGTKLNIDLIIPLLHSSFVILNLKWTYDLTMSKIRYFRRRALHEEYKVSKGL